MVQDCRCARLYLHVDALARLDLLGIKERYFVEIDGKGIAALSRGYELPPDYQSSEPGLEQWGGPVSIVCGFIGAILGVLQWRRVDIAASWRTFLGFVALLGARRPTRAHVQMSICTFGFRACC